MASAAIEFWFEFASTYSYLAASRIRESAQRARVAVTWQPFLLGPIFAEQGWNDSPFNLYPAKGRYMWRDLERLCRRDGLALTRPSQFPRNGLHAARIACVGLAEDWLPAFVERTYAANFARDADIGDPHVLAEILGGIGAAPEPILAAATSPANKQRLRDQTDRARALGIFGAPTFVARGEIFWGNDRLDDALAFATEGAADP